MKRENLQNKYVMDNILSLGKLKLLELITMVAHYLIRNIISHMQLYIIFFKEIKY